MISPLATVHLPTTDTTWAIQPHEAWAVVGPAGAGKGQLLGVLAGTARSEATIHYHAADGTRQTAYPDPSTLDRRQIVRVRFADQRDFLGHDAYHQARWNSFGCDDVMTAADALSADRIFRVSPYQILGPDTIPADFESHCRHVVETLGVDPLLNRKVAQLSNGERRKVMLARALVQRPRLLLLDDPFAGLDGAYRERLHGILAQLARNGSALVFSTPRIDDLGALATHTVRLAAGQATEIARWQPQRAKPAPAIRPLHARPGGKPIVELRNVSVRYGENTVLRNIDWIVREGEHWAILGANGAGKTTLLGLVLGDNPQTNALDVRVFGKRMGREICARELRENVGHVSPELHLSFPRASTALATVASGFFGSIGLYRQPGEEQWRQAESLLAQVHLAKHAGTPFGELSEGRQRLALLARAMVRTPRLLVLDEPCQGLDEADRTLVHTALGRLLADGGTQVLYVTHHPEDLPAAIGHVLRLTDGRAKVLTEG